METLPFAFDLRSAHNDAVTAGGKEVVLDGKLTA
jgi:hypothetical protein